jgi:hypothetical protein
MIETIRRQEVEATEVDDELSDEALDRRAEASSCYSAGSRCYPPELAPRP